MAVAVLAMAVGAVVAGPVGRARAANPTARWRGSWRGPFTMSWRNDGMFDRQYYVSVPPHLAPKPKRSLVVYLHGTTQTAEQAALAARWNDLADQEGFVVAYPEESADASKLDGGGSARFWSWGRAAYEGRDEGEMRTIAEITKKVAGDYRIGGGRVYMSGLSAGAIMATIMAATYPDLYSAVASWAGCSYLCSDPTGALAWQRMGPYARVVPAILFSGSTDYLVNASMTVPQVSGFVGMNDLADNGQLDGSVSPTPTEGPTTYGADPSSLQPDPNTGQPGDGRGDAGTCLNATTPKGNNPCPGATLGWQSYPYTVTRFGYAAHPSDVVVESWYIHGISHNYSGGSNEGTYADPIGPDTTTPAWRFFQAHARP
jgi:poly(hydroxyalkanoate) depolymerase family esterase